MTQSHDGETATAPDISREISKGIVHLYSELFGRGPTHAKTHVGDDHVLTILEETFTPAERTLVQADRSRQVEETRRAFQEAVRPDFIKVVEEATGRPVRSFMSQVDVETQAAIEFFLLGDAEGSPDGR